MIRIGSRKEGKGHKAEDTRGFSCARAEVFLRGQGGCTAAAPLPGPCYCPAAQHWTASPKDYETWQQHARETRKLFLPCHKSMPSFKSFTLSCSEHSPKATEDLGPRYIQCMCPYQTSPSIYKHLKLMDILKLTFSLLLDRLFWIWGFTICTAFLVFQQYRNRDSVLLTGNC